MFWGYEELPLFITILFIISFIFSFHFRLVTHIETYCLRNCYSYVWGKLHLAQVERKSRRKGHILMYAAFTHRLFRSELKSSFLPWFKHSPSEWILGCFYPALLLQYALNNDPFIRDRYPWCQYSIRKMSKIYFYLLYPWFYMNYRHFELWNLFSIKYPIQYWV
jgi:hypothetical protein